MYSNKLYTPLRYPGGKARFAPFIAKLMCCNDLNGGHYFEPYAGGAGVALELLFDGIVNEIHINDADPAVYDFWKAATRHTDEMIDRVATEPVDIESWHRWRAVVNGQIAASLPERGFATLFLNRTNRSGILKGGVIGGKNQSGEYKLDARFLRSQLCDRLWRIGQHADRINVYGEDALALLNRCKNFLPSQSLIYLDPPYYVKGQGLYRNFYNHEDHVAIAELVMRRSFPRNWMVSYDDVPAIRSMYRGSKVRGYGLHYTAQKRYEGTEVMFFSEGLRVPRSLKQAA